MNVNGSQISTLLIKSTKIWGTEGNPVIFAHHFCLKRKTNWLKTSLTSVYAQGFKNLRIMRLEVKILETKSFQFEEKTIWRTVEKIHIL